MELAGNCLLFYHRDLLRDQLLLLGSIVGASLIIGIYSGFESYNWGLFRVRVLYWQFTWVRVLSSRSGRYRVLVSILSIPGSVSGSRGSRTSNGHLKSGFAFSRTAVPLLSAIASHNRF